MNKSEFVQAMGDLLRLAKPHLVSCEYETTADGKEHVKVIMSEWTLLPCKRNRG